MRFTKMQGVGNDFVLIDARREGAHDWPALSERVCRRHFGVGADGLLVVEADPYADGRMRMFNPDGTEDFCGNGLRCVARYLADQVEPAETNGAGGQGNRGTTRLTVSTSAGLREAELRADGVVTVQMGKPRFALDDIPMLPPPGAKPMDYPLDFGGVTLRSATLSTGTTHTVLLVEDLPGDKQFFALSPLIEHSPLFPERTSIMWAVAEHESRLRLRIWERGAGETWGCGSGACAAAVAAIMRGVAKSPVTVASRGGELQIAWAADQPILMTGPAEYVFEGQLAG